MDASGAGRRRRRAHPSLASGGALPPLGEKARAAMVEVLCNVTPAAMVVDELRDNEAAKAAATSATTASSDARNAETLGNCGTTKPWRRWGFRGALYPDRGHAAVGAQRWGNFARSGQRIDGDNDASSNCGRQLREGAWRLFGRERRNQAIVEQWPAAAPLFDEDR